MGKTNLTAALGGTVVAVLALSSCQSSAGDSAETGSEELSLLLTNDPWSRAIEPRIPEFEQETGIDVQVEILGQEQANTKLLVSLQSGSPEVDVFQNIPSSEGVLYQNAGYYEPLDGYVESSLPEGYDFEGIPEGTAESARIDGELTGLPILVEGPLVYYRTDLFEEYGLDRPETLDDLAEAAQTTYENGDVTAVRGIPRAMVYIFGNFLHNMGVEWTGADGTPNFDSPEAVEAIEAYATIAREYGPMGVANNTYTQTSALMAQGEAAIAIESSNELAAMAGPDSSVSEDIGVMPVPAGPGGNHPTVLVKTLAMSAHSDAKDAAWQFMTWATSPEIQQELAADGVASPRGLGGTAAGDGGTIDPDLMAEWRESLQQIIEGGNGEVGPPAERQSEARELIGTAIGKVILEQSTAEEAAQEIQDGLSPLVEAEG